MRKVFLNYSWEHDSDTARRLYSVLTSEPRVFHVWMDKENLESGLKWRPAIRNAIREADFFISLISCNSVKGRGVRNSEIYQALEVLAEFPPAQVYLVPTRVNDCRPAFEQFNDLNWVDLFPKWEEGVSKLVATLNGETPTKPVRSLLGPESSGAKMQIRYRVGLVDIDMGLINLKEIAIELNRAQQYFLFTTPEMPRLRNVTEKIGGCKYFGVYNVPDSYIEEHPYLAVDLIACITKYPLAFEEDGQVLWNYFSGPSNKDERFLFISAAELYGFTKQAGCSFEEGLVYLFIGQIIGYFTELSYHTETEGCFMDFCQKRADLVEGLQRRQFCPACLERLPEGELLNAIDALARWKAT